MNGNKHPDNFEGYSPKEFAEKFVKTNYFYQLEVFKNLGQIYNEESKKDKKRPSKKNPENGRIQLSSNLEKLAKAINGSVLDAISKVCKSCEKYLKNPYK